MTASKNSLVTGQASSITSSGTEARASEIAALGVLSPWGHRRHAWALELRDRSFDETVDVLAKWSGEMPRRLGIGWRWCPRGDVAALFRHTGEKRSWPALSGKGETIPLLGPPRTSGTVSTLGDEPCINLRPEGRSVSGGHASGRSLRGGVVMELL